MKKGLFVIATCMCCNISFAQNVGIGTTSPVSPLHIYSTSPGELVRVQGNNPYVGLRNITGSLKSYVQAFDDDLYVGTAFGNSNGAIRFYNNNLPNMSILPNGNVGIGTTTPATRLSVSSILYGIEHTDGLRSVGTYLNSSGGWFGTRSNHPLHFFTNDGVEQMTLNQAGQVGIGTTTPTGGYLLDVAGYVKSFGNSTGFVAQTTGGTNSWARYYMRSGIGGNAQGWFMGTSQNFNGNQLYIGDETNNHTRFSIQPNNGPIYMQGNITQNAGSFGLPKAMLYINGDGTIIRCYNGITGSTSAPCNFSVTRLLNGYYRIDFGFQVNNRFFSLTAAEWDRLAQGFLDCGSCTANQMVVQIVNNANVDADGRVMVIMF